MKKNPTFSGVIAPVLTPYDDDGVPDADRFVDHCEWLLEDGCTALAPFGTTSEANSLGLDERMELLEIMIDDGIEPEKLMPGTGTCSLSDTVVLTSHAVESGCAGVLMLPPFYYKGVSDDGLFAYYADVIDQVGDDKLRIYLYHIPPVAQVGISLKLIERLVKEFPDVVIGLKDSSGDWNNTKAVLDTFGKDGFEVFPGSESFLLDGLRAGGVGCISASANVAARRIRAVFDNWQGANADKLQADITALRKSIQGFPMIPVLKALVAHYRDDPVWAKLRPPFVDLPDDVAARAVRELAEKHDFRLEFAEAT